MFLESCPFLLGCQISCHIIVHSILFFVFLQYQLRFLLFSFLFCLFGFSLFSSWWAWPEVFQFCLPFQRTSSWFYWFFFLYFFSISWDFSSFIYYFVYLGSLSFLLGEPGQRFVNFVYPFKEPTLGMLIFSIFFNLYFIYFLLDLYYFLPFANFRFCSCWILFPFVFL